MDRTEVEAEAAVVARVLRCEEASLLHIVSLLYIDVFSFGSEVTPSLPVGNQSSSLRFIFYQSMKMVE